MLKFGQFCFVNLLLITKAGKEMYGFVESALIGFYIVLYIIQKPLTLQS